MADEQEFIKVRSPKTMGMRYRIWIDCNTLAEAGRLEQLLEGTTGTVQHIEQYEHCDEEDDATDH